MNNNDANAIQNRIRNSIDIKKQCFEKHEKQVFYWYQARDASTKAGDKGIIEKFSPKPLPVIFSAEDIKTLMLEPALFSKGYVVDVEIGFIEQTPVSYKIIHFHQTIDKA